MPFDKTVCFFCEGKGNSKQPLHDVSTFSAGESLNEAINLSENNVLRVKRSTMSSMLNDVGSIFSNVKLACKIQNCYINYYACS